MHRKFALRMVKGWQEILISVKMSSLIGGPCAKNLCQGGTGENFVFKNLEVGGLKKDLNSTFSLLPVK